MGWPVQCVKKKAGLFAAGIPLPNVLFDQLTWFRPDRFFLHLRAFILSFFLLFPFFFFAQTDTATSLPPAITYHIQGEFDTLKLPALQWILEEGEQPLSYEKLMAGELADAQLLDLKASPLFPIKAHRGYWFKIRLTASGKPGAFGLTFYRNGDCWPYEPTFKDVQTSSVGQAVDNPTLGTYSELMGLLNDAVTAFQSDLQALGIEKRVLTMTFSEFGRRIISNDSSGTDHGDAAPLLLFGSCVAPGFLGDSPDIPANPAVGDAVPMQYDFRNVYGSVFMDWFGVPEADVKSLLFNEFQKLPIIEGCVSVDTFEAVPELEANIFPNPFSSQVNIRFTSGNEHVRLSVFNGMGQELNILTNKKLSKGSHELTFDGSHLSAGSYYFHLRLEGGRQKTKLVVKGRD